MFVGRPLFSVRRSALSALPSSMSHARAFRSSPALFAMKPRQSNRDNDQASDFRLFDTRDQELSDEIASRVQLSKPTMEYIERLEACRHKGDVSGAFALFNEMIEKKIDPSPKAIDHIVNASLVAKDLPSALAGLELARQYNLQLRYGLIGSFLVECTKANRVDLSEKAMELFDKLGRSPSIGISRAFVDGFFRNRRFNDGMIQFHNRFSDRTGLIADAETYHMLIFSAGKNGGFDVAINLYKEMKKKGLAPSDRIYRYLQSQAAMVNKMELAKSIFDEMRADVRFSFSVIFQGIPPHPYAATALIDGFMRAKRIDEAIQIFELTKDASGEPEFGLYTAIMKAYGIKGDANMILRLFDEMRKKDIPRHELTYSTAIVGLSQNDRTADALDLVNEAHDNGIPVNTFTYNYLIKALGRRRMVDEILKAMADMKTYDVTRSGETYAVAIFGASLAKQPDKALLLFRMMVGENVEPFDAVFASILVGFDLTERTNEAIEFFENLHVFRKPVDIKTYSSYMPILGKLPEAVRLKNIEETLNEMKDKNIKLDEIFYQRVMKVVAPLSISKLTELYKEMLANDIMRSPGVRSVLFNSFDNFNKFPAHKKEEARQLLHVMRKDKQLPNFVRSVHLRDDTTGLTFVATSHRSQNTHTSQGATPRNPTPNSPTSTPL